MSGLTGLALVEIAEVVGVAVRTDHHAGRDVVEIAFERELTMAPESQLGRIGRSLATTLRALRGYLHSSHGESLPVLGRT